MGHLGSFLRRIDKGILLVMFHVERSKWALKREISAFGVTPGGMLAPSRACCPSNLRPRLVPRGTQNPPAPSPNDRSGRPATSALSISDSRIPSRSRTKSRTHARGVPPGQPLARTPVRPKATNRASSRVAHAFRSAENSATPSTVAGSSPHALWKPTSDRSWRSHSDPRLGRHNGLVESEIERRRLPSPLTAFDRSAKLAGCLTR